MTSDNYKPMPMRSTAAKRQPIQFPIPSAGETHDDIAKRLSKRGAPVRKRDVAKPLPSFFNWRPGKNRLPFTVEVGCATDWNHGMDTMQIAQSRNLTEAQVYNALDWIKDRAKRLRVQS